ncbi:hypothetical protein M9458_037032, partial [Cirrhinus mrigala]
RCRPRLRDRPGTPAEELRSVPDAGNPEVKEIAISSPLGDALPPRIRTRSLISPAREPGKKTFLQDVPPSGISPLPLPLPGCPTAVTLVNVPLIPLATRLVAWLQLPSPLRWLIRTVRLGYAIQFARRPPRYRGVLSTTVHSDTQTAVLRAEIAVLLAKDAIEPVPPAEIKSGFYSPYFIVPKKSGGLRPILYLRALNRSLLRLPFKMLMTKRMLTCIRRQDWFAAIDLKDAYFHQRARAVSAELSELVQTQDSGPSQNISEAPGACGSCSRGDAAGLASYETASALAWHRGTLRIGVSLQCRRLFSPPEHLVVYTDASSTGWGAVCNGQAASGSWTGPRLQWHIKCLELLAVLLALRRFRPMLRHKHVLVRTDSTATVAYINHQGGLRSRRMSQLARHLLLWSQTWLKSLRAIHIPGELNRAADQLSRQSTHPGEWRLHPQVVQLIWSHFGEAQIDLFASPESSHCQLFYSLSEAPLGWHTAGLRGPSTPFPQEDEEQVLLVAPYWPTRTCPSLEDPLEERPSFAGDGHNLAPTPRPMEPARLAPGRDASDLSGLSQAVIETIT